ADMVLLDQNHVVEAEAMVHPTTGDHGPFLERPHAGCRLASVEDPCLRPVHCIDERPRHRRYPRESLEEVQSEAFPGKNGSGGAPEGENLVASGHSLAVRDADVDDEARVHVVKGHERRIQPGNYAWRLGDDPASRDP